MADYVTTTQVSAFAHEFGALGGDGQALLVTAASRLFDTLCEVDEDFFAEEGGLTEDRDFIGDGTAYLKLPPYVDLDTVTINEGTIETPDFTDDNVPDYVAQNGMLVVLSKTMQQSAEAAFYPNRFTGWPDGKQIRIGAVWGFEFTPADVTFACVHLALHLWRTGDPAFATISNAEGAASRAATVPQIAQQIIDKYREKYSRRSLFA
jgi:hypothetical protein